MSSHSKERQELLARLLAERGLAASSTGPARAIPRLARGALAPLSFDQQRLWFLDQLEPGSSLYNDCFDLRIVGVQLDVAAFRRALQAIVARHDSLRMSFRIHAGRPVLHVEPALELPLALHDLRVLGASAGSSREAQARALLLADVNAPFALDRAPLARATLIRLADDTWSFGLTMHHIISDGASYGIFYRELGQLYEGLRAGRPTPLEALPVGFADYAAWERSTLDEPRIAVELEHWKRALAGALEPLPLPFDRPLATQRHRGALHKFLFPSELHGVLVAFARREGSTTHWVMLTVYLALLAELSGESDLLIGMPSSSRRARELEGLIGFFVRTLLLRVDLAGDPSFREALDRTRRAVLGAHQHEEVPFDRVVQALRAAGTGQSMLIRAWFAHMRDLIAPAPIAGASTCYEVVDGGIARFPLSLILDETERGVFANVEYDTDLFEPRTIERFQARYLELLRGALAAPERRLSELCAPAAVETPRRVPRDARLVGLKKIARRPAPLGNLDGGTTPEEAP
jgi:hypothetical protein